MNNNKAIQKITLQLLSPRCNIYSRVCEKKKRESIIKVLQRLCDHHFNNEKRKPVFPVVFRSSFTLALFSLILAHLLGAETLIIYSKLPCLVAGTRDQFLKLVPYPKAARAPDLQ